MHVCVCVDCQLVAAMVDAHSENDFSDGLTTLCEQYEQVYQYFVDNWLPYEEHFGLFNFTDVRTLYNKANNRMEWYVTRTSGIVAFD